MTLNHWKQTMIASISEVTETMFYSIFEFTDAPPEYLEKLHTEKELTLCRIAFFGNPSGRLTGLAPASVLKKMAADFMGEDLETISHKDQEETLKELLNMVGGNFCAALPIDPEPQLGIPERIIDESDISSLLTVPHPGWITATGVDGIIGFILDISDNKDEANSSV